MIAGTKCLWAALPWAVNQSVKVARKTAILDSGTNILLVPTPSFNGITEVFEGYCQAGKKLKGICEVPVGSKSLLKGGCWSITPAEAAVFPFFRRWLSESPLRACLNMPPSTYLRTGDLDCASAPCVFQPILKHSILYYELTILC